MWQCTRFRQNIWEVGVFRLEIKIHGQTDWRMDIVHLISIVNGIDRHSGCCTHPPTLLLLQTIYSAIITAFCFGLVRISKMWSERFVSACRRFQRLNLARCLPHLCCLANRPLGFLRIRLTEYSCVWNFVVDIKLVKMRIENPPKKPVRHEIRARRNYKLIIEAWARYWVVLSIWNR